MSIALSTEKSILSKSLWQIVHQLELERNLSPAQMARILKDAHVQPKDLLPWAVYDHPVQDSYGRKMVFKGEHFEIMAMSWRPGDFSAIHDHGHTQWGAVQIFGPGEHATFRVKDNQLTTLSRWQVTPGDVIGVGHSLIHQMGNPTTDVFFQSLHVYGDVINQKSVTSDARLFDLRNNTIQRVDGGVFYALPNDAIKTTEPGPIADPPTRLRNLVELIRRLRKIENICKRKNLQLLNLENEFFSKKQGHILEEYLRKLQHQHNSISWKTLKHEVKEAAALQQDIFKSERIQEGFFDFQKLSDKIELLNPVSEMQTLAF